MSHIRTASGRRISYDESGTGPPVLLIPGHGGYRRGCLIWLAEALAPHFRVVAMDNRDAGESEPETAYYGLPDMAGDAVALLDALGIDRTHVLAQSMDSAIALQLALDYPTRVDRLVLVSPAVGGEPGHRAGEPLPPPDAWWVDDPVARTPRVLPVVVGSDYRSRMSEADVAAIAELERGNRTTWAGLMRQEAAAGGADLLDRLAEIGAATLVIHGDADVPVPLEQGQALAAGIPGVGRRPTVQVPNTSVALRATGAASSAPTVGRVVAPLQKAMTTYFDHPDRMAGRRLSRPHTQCMVAAMAIIARSLSAGFS